MLYEVITENDSLTSAAIAASGGVYVGGGTEGVLDGTSNAGLRDAFIAHYDVDGNQLWIEQFGTSEGDLAYGAASDGNGGVFLTGYTEQRWKTRTNFPKDEIKSDSDDGEYITDLTYKDGKGAE